MGGNFPQAPLLAAFAECLGDHFLSLLSKKELLTVIFIGDFYAFRN